MNINDIIQGLNLKRHPEEGGFYCETFRSEQRVGIQDRSLYTAIYYLLTPDTFSRIHRLKSDEIFHFYLGDPIEMVQLHPDGRVEMFNIGNDILNGFKPQVLVPKNVWQGSRLLPGGRYALMGTTMSPGFEYSDYETGQREQLIQQYPDHERMIVDLTTS